jgi:UDP-glucuronate decarboxylase
MLIGIVGNGFVGKATKLLKSPSINILVYDIRLEACEPPGTSLSDLEKCDIVFYCLPTPMNHHGKCYTKLLEDAIPKLQNKFKVIRSTVPVGFSQSQGCFFMPEFLTETNWHDDFVKSTHWVFGLLQGDNITELNNDFRERINKLFNTSWHEGLIESNTTRFITNNEAEMLKLVKNCYLSAKVGIMNELYDLCQAKNVNYENVKKLLLLDPRIGTTHMNVPGYGDLRGFGGTCFPKDTHSLYSQFQEAGVPSIIYQSILDRNDNVDRPQREWATDKWRTTIPAPKPISLVTGGAGFLGSNLCGRLLQEGHIVICLDNLQTGSLNNIEEFKNNPDFLFKCADITNKQYFPRIDFIWHLACPASPPKYQADGYKTLQTSILGTMNMLDLARVHQSTLLFSSTSEIYGDPLEHPQSETYWGNVNPVGPRSCYDEGKRCAETLIYEYRKKQPELANKLKIVRIFNTYGPKMDFNDGRVITNYIKCYLLGNSITIYGDGSQTRSFCYVDDMINGFIKMMFSNEVGPINLGNPYNELSMIELKALVENITEQKLEIEYKQLPENDPKQRKPNITLAIEKLGWEPVVSVEYGFKKTLEYFDKLLV